MADSSVRARSVVLDCPDPTALAIFYGRLLEAPVDTTDPGWCEVHPAGAGVKLAFQLAGDYRRPEWPHGTPQQLHLDFEVVDLAAASDRAVAVGATVVGEPVDDGGGGVFLVHLDPAGHPFCLCRVP